MSDLRFRPLKADEFELFNRYATPPTSGVGARSRTFDEYVADGDYRPDWVWVALRDGEVVARIAIWGPEESEVPWSVEFFDFDEGEVGAALLTAAYDALVPPDYATPSGSRPDYHLFFPSDWRERPDALADAEKRIAAAENAGLNFQVERLNLLWEPEYGLPPRSTRLTFTPAVDDEVVVDLKARILVGSLDDWDRRTLAKKSALETAREGMDDVAGMPGGRDRWRLAHNASGELVGIVMPTRNPSSATIGYLGVDPAHRGHHYSDDLVAEALHIFAEGGEPQVTDNTDVGNVPMAASFARVGYRVTGRRMVFG